MPRSNDSVRFAIAGASWSLEFSTEATAALASYAQRESGQLESAGQLFSSDLTKDTVKVDLVSFLKPRWASRGRVSFNIEEARKQREQFFTKGMHCIGLWHTHPEPICSPSPTDNKMAQEHAKAAMTSLSGLVFVIVSTQPYPFGWFVGAHDANRFHQMDLKPQLE